VDDLKKEEDDSGADTIQETELTCGVFYGYAVIDLPGLIANCGGDRDLAGRVVHNLVYLIAEVSPGAKVGSTAPYGRASFMLLEVGDRHGARSCAAPRFARDRMSFGMAS
jgi:CRISPR system Cascade subunit CasC